MAGAVIAVEVMSVIIHMIVITGCFFQNIKSDRGTRRLAILSFVCLLGTAADIPTFIIENHSQYTAAAFCLTFLALLFGVWFEVAFACYVSVTIGIRSKIINSFIISEIILALIGTAVVAVGSITGSVFTLNNAYMVQGDWYYASYLIATIQGVITGIVCIAFREKLGRYNVFAFLGCLLVPFIAAVVETAVPGLYISYAGLAVCTLVLYVLVQASEIQSARTKEEVARLTAKSRAEFMAGISHEIRTPINALLGLNEMILRESGEKEIREYSMEIKSAGTTLLSLVTDVLDSSKIESGKMSIVNGSYDTVSVLNDIYNVTWQQLDKKGLDFKFLVDESLPAALIGDEVKIKQIINNLLSNAIKYTNTGYVEFAMAVMDRDETGVNLWVAVTDTGIGISEEDKEKLGQAFERVDEVKNKYIKGTGLGIYIVENYLKMMGSGLNVESIYGKGSCFSFEVRQEIGDETPIGDFAEAVRKYRDEMGGYESGFRAPTARILVVDDIEVNIVVVQGLLKGTQIRVDEALSGNEAIAKCINEKYDLILMDQMMPEMDGVQAMHQIRERIASANRSTPIIALTANAVGNAKEYLMQEGFDGYLAKPVSPADLERTIIEMLPESKVERISREDTAGTAEINDSAGLQEIEGLKSIGLLNVDEAVDFSGGRSTYLEIAGTFCNKAKGQLEKIKEFRAAGDLEAYSIQVHALKSSAKLVGDTELSDMALELELASKDGDAGIVEEKTDALLQRYERLTAAMAAVLNSSADADMSSEKNGIVISQEEWKNVSDLIIQSAEDFDIDTLEALVKKLSEYSLDDEKQSVLDRLIILVDDMEYEEISSLMGGDRSER